MPVFLHVGCGPKRKTETTPLFAGPDWRELRLDIDPAAEADFVCGMTDMAPVATGSVDAIFSSHNLEHLHPHEVPQALAEFRRVLKPDGHVVITCPDVQMVAIHVAQGRLMDPLYDSPMGPISAIDILYGHRASMARGNLYMAHRTAFTLQSLVDAIKLAGFKSFIGRRRREHLDLWVIGSMAARPEAEMSDLLAGHLPAP